MTFKGKLQILRTKSEPSALHGAEASPTSKTATTSLKTACCAAAWSSRMPLADSGAVLSMPDGSKRCLAFRPEEIRRIYKMLERKVVLGLSLSSASVLGWTWNGLQSRFSPLGVG